MPYEINQQEFHSVLGLPAPERYSHFIKRIADCEEIWSLRSEDGWVLSGDEQGRKLVPVWPHPLYAEICAVGEWAETRPEAIALNEWLDRWIPGMSSDQRLISVFPTPQGQSIAVEPNRLKEDLEREISRYEWSGMPLNN